ncbi:MAG: hypothetical protein C4334_11540 [Pyrinomonas sp.]
MQPLCRPYASFKAAYERNCVSARAPPLEVDPLRPLSISLHPSLILLCAAAFRRAFVVEFRGGQFSHRRGRLRRGRLVLD